MSVQFNYEVVIQKDFFFFVKIVKKGSMIVDHM